MTNDTTVQDPPAHNPAHTVADRFAARLLRASLDALANQRTLWPVTPQEQQQQVIDRLRESFRDVILEQLRSVASAGISHCEVLLQSLTAKGEATKVTAIAGGGTTLHDLVDSLGRKVVLVLMDAESWTEGMESFEAQKDQPDLPLEGGSEPPAGSPVRCSCAAQVYDPDAKHEPDCEYLRWFKQQNQQGESGQEAA